MESIPKLAWDWEPLDDQSCGYPCTQNGCHDGHFSGYYAVNGPELDGGGEESRYAVKSEAMVIAAAPALLAALIEARDMLTIPASYADDPDIQFGLKLHARSCKRLVTELDTVIALTKD